MRIRKPFAGAFAALVLVAGYLGLAPPSFELPGQYQQSDKVLHFVTFFLLTGTFYWILDAARRRVLHLTLLVCTVGLGIASEVVQGLLPNGRDFDIFDIAANTVGSLAALAACTWYHQRMIERKRAAKIYTAVPGDEETGGGGLPHPDDMELEEQESGTIPVAHKAGEDLTVDDELDQWDENAADDWDDQEPEDAGHDTAKGSEPQQEDASAKKRVD